MKKLLYAIIVICIFSCAEKSQGVQVPEDAIQNDSIKKESDSRVDKDERSDWQKPEFVINSLGPLEGKVLADIGAGALGYFVFKIVGRTEIGKIIAIDIDKEAVNMLNILKDALNEDKSSRIEVRLADVNDPKIKENEADIILIVNTIAYIPDRLNYFQRLKTRLKDGGRIVIVDFKTKRIPDYVDAPPYDERVYLHILEEELLEAGFSTVKTDDTSLDFQYHIIAEI